MGKQLCLFFFNPKPIKDFPPNSEKCIWSLHIGYWGGGLDLIFGVDEQLLQEPMQNKFDTHQTRIERNIKVAPTSRKSLRLVCLFYSSLLPQTSLRKLYQFFENYLEKYFSFFSFYVFFEDFMQHYNFFIVKWHISFSLIIYIHVISHHCAHNALNLCNSFISVLTTNLSPVFKLGLCRLSLLSAHNKLNVTSNICLKIFFFVLFLPNKKNPIFEHFCPTLTKLCVKNYWIKRAMSIKSSMNLKI